MGTEVAVNLTALTLVSFGFGLVLFCYFKLQVGASHLFPIG